MPKGMSYMFVLNVVSKVTTSPNSLYIRLLFPLHHIRDVILHSLSICQEYAKFGSSSRMRMNESMCPEPSYTSEDLWLIWIWKQHDLLAP
uniref:Uncharacterized protein n=1 Tax=Arundo donax TaxID=35708 RepID=A0A0A8ZNN6_ARUDO